MFIIDLSKNLKTTKKPNLSEPPRQKANFLHKVLAGVYKYLSLISAKSTKQRKNPTTQSLSEEQPIFLTNLQQKCAMFSNDLSEIH